jgi:hypothetical protein
MTRRSLIGALIAAALVPASAAAAMNGQLAQTCAPGGQQAQAVCYGGDVLVRDGQAYAQPGRFEAGIEDYEQSWTHRTIAFQYSLANDVGFVNAPWLGTHNSFNSIAQQGAALSTTDANQQLTLVDQLRMDMRSLELDIHWFPSARAGGAYAPVVCHAGAVSEHDGCSTEPLLGPVLDQIAGWLHGHRDQVLLLYLEDHLDSGYDTASAAIKQSLGSLVYPTGSSNGTSVELPGTLTRDKVLAAGHQVVLVSNSGSGGGAAWRSLVYTWNNHREETPHGYAGWPICGPDFTRADYDTRLVRYYEDSTWLSAADGAATNTPEGEGLTPADVGQMVRCGVDLFGFDQLQPGDGRLDAAVWSWADDQPAGGSCAAIRSDGRWFSSGCKKTRPAACRNADGSWSVTNPVTEADAAAECAAAGGRFTAPRTGYQNQLLKEAAAGRATWVGLEKTHRTWHAT